MEDTIYIKFIGAEISLSALLAEKSEFVRAWMNFGRQDNYVYIEIGASAEVADVIKKYFEGEDVEKLNLNRATLFNCLTIADFLILSGLIEICSKKIGESFLNDMFV
jgi:hypothetical protein